MKQKFQKLMLEEHLTAGKLAEMLEVQPAVISHMLSGRNKPSFPLIQKILRRFPHLNPYWLLLDDPQMYKDGYEPSDHEPSSTEDLFTVLQPKTTANTENRTESSKDSLTSRESHILDAQSNRTEILNSYTGSQIERIIVLYSDGTFRDFTKH